jgi:hypothetical protein
VIANLDKIFLSYIVNVKSYYPIVTFINFPEEFIADITVLFGYMDIINLNTKNYVIAMKIIFTRFINKDRVYILQIIFKSNIYYKNFWDKDLDRMLKSRRETNQLQRLHNKHRPRDSELGQNISDLYRERKKLLHDAIKRKESHNKMNFIYR